MATPDTLSTLEQRVERLEKQGRGDRKSAWVNVLGSILVPLAIGVAGLLVSNAIADRDRRIKEIDAKVAQADVVTKLLETLAGENGPKKRLAIKAVLIALPEDGPDLVRDIASDDPDPAVKRLANTTLEDRVTALIADLYAGNPDVRKNAAGRLVDGWSASPEIVPRLIDYANSHWDNQNGVYNTVVVLAGMSPDALARYKQQLAPFLNRAESKGQKTKTQADRVRALIT